MISVIAAVALVATGLTSTAAHAASKPLQRATLLDAPPVVDSDGCPLYSTDSKTFPFGPNTGTVTINLYFSATQGCFNGYERIWVSKGSGTFGSMSLGYSWLQFWYSTDGGATYNWITGQYAEECLEDDAPALLDTGNAGQCIQPFFTFPRTSMAWAETNDYGAVNAPDYCYLIQNLPNTGYWDEPETVWDSGNTTQYQVPSITLHVCES
jgi:hypothetical protein